jgi:NTE family protein
MKKIGLAIGAGSARGISAIGVLKVIDKYRIPIDFIAGTSMGAVIGAAYASGLSSSELEEKLTHTNFKKLVDFTLPQKGLVRGKRLEKFLRKLFRDKEFSELRIPLVVIATDLNENKMVEFNKGDVTNAVRASLSIPGIFNPVEMDNMLLVDGGLINPLPVDVVKKNAKKVIAIDFSPDIKTTKNKVSLKKNKNEFVSSLKDIMIKTEVAKIREYINVKNIKLPLAFKFFLNPERVTRYVSNFPFSTPQILDITLKSVGISIHELARAKLKQTKVDVVIRPNLPDVSWFDFDKTSFCVKQGEKAALNKIKEIKKLRR